MNGLRYALVWIALAARMPAATGAESPPRPTSLETADPMVVERVEEAWRGAVDEPGNATRWLELGKVYHAHELTEPAVLCYRRATELAPAGPRPWYFLAVALAELGEPGRALEALDHVIAIAPSYAPAHWRRGRWLEDLGRTEEAEAAFRRSVDIDPAAAAGWVGIAEVLLAGGGPREAIAILSPVLAADRTNGVAGQLLGRALLAVGEEVAARRVLAMTAGMGAYFPDPWLEEVLSTATGVVNILRRLSARMERGELDRVIRELETLRAAHPEHLGLLNKLSEGYLQRGRIDAAREVLEAALVVDPGEFTTLVHMAQAERFSGNLTAALDWADRAVAANPRLWQGHFERAAILHRGGRLEECLAALESAMSHGAHENPNAWLMRGDAQIRMGAWVAAADTFERATDRFPFLGQAWVGLAVARVEQGLLDEARAALESAGELQGEDGTMAQVRARIEELERATGPPE